MAHLNSNRYCENAVPEELLGLVNGFLKRRSEEIPVLREALKRGDFKTIGVVGHKLKGNGLGYGFPGLTQIGAKLETAAKDLNGQVSIQLIEDYEEVVKELISQFP